MNEELFEELAPDEESSALEIPADENTLQENGPEEVPEAPQESFEEMPGEDIDDEKELLRAEIEALKAELESRGKVRERCVAELREFSDIFGKDTLDEVPESVWARVDEGVPLAAAYALYEKKNALLMEKAEAVNKKNASMTTGAINNATVSGFFSPAEVKAMSAKEVKRNYDLIIESMKKWN